MNQLPKPLIKLLIILPATILLISCNSNRGLFSKRTAHEAYAKNLTDAGLANSRMGSAWFTAAAKSITSPLNITLPYKESGYFADDRPSAAGYSFNARRGEKIIIDINTTPQQGFKLFTELYSIADNKHELLEAADTLARKIEYEISREGKYLVRIQPELLRGVGYTVTITTAPSIAFPVRKEDNPKVQSFWGVARDGGKRSHEGIDIFAKKRTPVIASADGIVTRVNENQLGGKVIFMRPSGKNYSLYYAHLDEQLVQSGQNVNTGQVLGLMGNTGNAKTTAPHLHFGIYTNNGAVDPYPFVQSERPVPKAVKGNLKFLDKTVRLTTDTDLNNDISESKKYNTKLSGGSIVRITGATDSYYKISTPSNEEGFIKTTVVSEEPLKQLKIPASVMLYDNPAMDAAVKKQLAKGESVQIKGSHSGYYLVTHNGIEGWILK